MFQNGHCLTQIWTYEHKMSWGEVYFVISMIFIGYTYIGYYVLLRIKFFLLGSKSILYDESFQPSISIIIAARNEAAVIENRLNNLLDTDYPVSKIEIIIISDHSTDHTCQLVLSFKENHPGIRLKLIELTSHTGKPGAINIGIKEAENDFILFTDSRQRFLNNSISQLMKNFSDPGVGCVSGQLFFEKISNSNIKEEMGVYWEFEKKIRILESKTGSSIGATGAIYAIRKELYIDLPETIYLDDVLTPMNIAMQGYRVVYESESVAYDIISGDYLKEKSRKIRTLAGNWQLMYLCSDLLNPFKNTQFLRFMSHKIFRLFVPYVFISMVFSVIFSGNYYLSVSVLFFILLAILLTTLENYLCNNFLIKLVKIIKSVTMLNYFALIAPFKMFAKKSLWC